MWPNRSKYSNPETPKTDFEQVNRHFNSIKKTFYSYEQQFPTLFTIWSKEETNDGRIFRNQLCTSIHKGLPYDKDFERTDILTDNEDPPKVLYRIHRKKALNSSEMIIYSYNTDGEKSSFQVNINNHVNFKTLPTSFAKTKAISEISEKITITISDKEQSFTIIRTSEDEFEYPEGLNELLSRFHQT